MPCQTSSSVSWHSKNFPELNSSAAFWICRISAGSRFGSGGFSLIAARPGGELDQPGGQKRDENLVVPGEGNSLSSLPHRPPENIFRRAVVLAEIQIRRGGM